MEQPNRPTLACVAALNCGELARLEPLLAPACKNVVPTLGRLPDGPLGLQMYWSVLDQAFAPLHLEARSHQRRGQWEWTRLRLLGLHTDEFMGLAPTFRYLELEVAWKARVTDGQITEARLEFDLEALLAQLRSRSTALTPPNRHTPYPSITPE